MVSRVIFYGFCCSGWYGGGDGDGNGDGVNGDGIMKHEVGI